MTTTAVRRTAEYHNFQTKCVLEPQCDLCGETVTHVNHQLDDAECRAGKPRRAGAGEQWRVVKLGRNTYIERDGESPFVCDMQTYDSSNAEREEAVALASEIVRRYETHAILVAALEKARYALKEVAKETRVSGHGLSFPLTLQEIEEALQKAQE